MDAHNPRMTREILQDQVYDACQFVLSKGPRYEIETLHQLKKVSKLLRHNSLETLMSIMSDLTDMGFIENKDSKYSLVE